MTAKVFRGYTLGGVPRPLALVCVKENPLAVAWHTPVNKEPFLYAVAINTESYSLELLKQGADFTINFLPKAYLEEILKAGNTSGRQVNKWEILNLTPERAREVEANFVKEAILVYECKQVFSQPFQDHYLFVGEVLLIHYKSGKAKPKSYPLFAGKNLFL